MRPRPSTYTVLFKLSLFLSPAYIFSRASAQLVNTTIDDANGDQLTGRTIQYDPPSLWHSGNQSLCTNCTAHPDATHMSGGTWHEGASLPSPAGRQSEALSASVGFLGSAVYVYCIVGPFWQTDLTLYLDDEHVGTFALAAKTTRAYEYDVLVCAATSLRSEEHILTILSGTGGGNDTLVLLDRIVYTRDSAETPIVSTDNATTSLPASSTSIFVGPSATPNSQPNLSAGSTTSHSAILIVCVLVGVLVMTAVVGGSLKLWKRYKRARLPPSALYRRSVGTGGTQVVQPEPRVVGGDGGERGDLVTSARGTGAGADLEAAAVGGETSPHEVERTRSGRGTPYHESLSAPPDEIEEVSRS